MKRVSIVVVVFLLTGCAAKTVGRDSCATQLSAAWRELDLAEAEGFAGTVSYGKAFTLLTYAKGQQTIERFPSCVEKAKNARVYIAQSRKGQ